MALYHGKNYLINFYNFGYLVNQEACKWKLLLKIRSSGFKSSLQEMFFSLSSFAHIVSSKLTLIIHERNIPSDERISITFMHLHSRYRMVFTKRVLISVPREIGVDYKTIKISSSFLLKYDYRDLYDKITAINV